MWLYELSISYPLSYRSSSSTTYAFKMLNRFKRGKCVIFMFISLVTFLRFSTEKKSVNIWCWSRETLMTTRGCFLFLVFFFSCLTKLVSFYKRISTKKMSAEHTNGFLVSKSVVFSKLFFYLNFLWQVQFSSQFSHSVVSNSLQPHESQHARPPCPSPIPRVHSNSRPSSRWCHPAISSSVIPFPSCPQPSQHQSLFQWDNSSHEVAKVLEFQL